MIIAQVEICAQNYLLQIYNYQGYRKSIVSIKMQRVALQIKQEIQENISSLIARDPTYTLAISYNSQQKSIKITLALFQPECRYFQNFYLEQKLPFNICKLGLDPQLLFLCFQQHTEIDMQNGIICANSRFKLKGKILQQKIFIQLAQKSSQRLSLIKYAIRQIQADINQMKINHQNMLENFNSLSEGTVQIKERSAQHEMLQENSILQQNLQNINQQIQNFKISFLEFQKQRKYIMKEIQQIGAENDNFARCIQQKLQSAKQQQYNTVTNMSPVQASQMMDFPEENKQIVNAKQKESKIISQLKVLNKKNNQNFQIDNLKNLIKLKANKKKGNQIIINSPMRYSFPGKRGFKVKIVRTKHQQIKIGVIDRGNAQTRYTKAATFYEGNGRIQDRMFKQSEGKGFVTGDFVEITLHKGYIQWAVNGIVEATYKSEKLSKQYLTYFPIIEMDTVQDCIQWIANS